MAYEAENAAEILFPAGTSGDDATHYGFWTALNGGTFFGGKAITSNVAALSAGDRYRFPAGTVRIVAEDGEFTDAMAERMLDGAIAGTIYVSLHDAAPGDTGVNEIAGQVRQAMSAADWTKNAV